MGDQCAGDGDLLLAAGELVGQVVRSLGEADLFQRAQGTCAACALLSVEQWQLDVVTAVALGSRL